MRRILKRSLRHCGLEVSRYGVGTSQLATLMCLLSHHQVDLILDVGANVGQYAMDLRAAGYKGRIVSFEPLSEAHRKLKRKSDADVDWLVAPQMAIGDVDMDTEINVSRNSVSSSIRTMLEDHVQSAPASVNIGMEKVVMRTLDSVAAPFIEGARAPFLKVDTQGYEAQVLAGAEQLMPRLCGLQLELTLVPLYEGQSLFQDMLKFMVASGFDLHGLVPGFTDSHTGRLLQTDGVFFRT